VCHVCQAPEAEYISTRDAPPECPPIPVCGIACEATYLEQNGCMPVKTGLHKRRKRKCGISALSYTASALQSRYWCISRSSTLHGIS
jgi:hypothetical protein